MEYELLKKSLGAAYTLLDTVSEQPVDADLTLPDYCPDIERILRCSLIPRIYLSNISGDRLVVEGGATVRMIYTDSEKGCIRSFEYSSPFSESFPLKDSPDDCAVYVDTKPEYMNCRALSPRKLSIHGAFSLYARVVAEKPLTYYDCEDDGLQVDREDITASELSGVCRDMFSVREDISMSGRPEATAFITHSLTAKMTEMKAIGSKIMLTAEMKLELMYLSGRDGVPELMSCSFPISRIVDCDGADEDSVIDPRLDVMTYDLSLSGDALDASDVLTVDAKLCFNALCYNETDISVIRDAFAVDRETEVKTEQFFCKKKTLCLSFSDITKAAVSVDGDSITKVIDISSKRITVSAAISGGAPLLSSKMDIAMIYENSSGETKSVERSIDFDYNPSVDDIDSIESVTDFVDSLSYRIVDERTVELRAEICYRMTVSKDMSRSVVTAVSADDDAEPISPDGRLILCYADKGERVWDISKRYRSRPSDIMDENDLSSDILDEDTMLLIPVNG